jgi:hypothetical protein
MRSTIKILTILIAGICCWRCTVSEFDSVQALNDYIASPGNKLTQVTESNGYRITLTYRPTGLLVHQEIGDDPHDSSAISASRKKYTDYYYFVLSLSKKDKEALHQTSGMAEYSELVQTLSFRMGNYVTLTTSSADTVPAGDFMLDRTYGLSQSTDLLFVFNKEETQGKEWVQFNLNEFGLGAGNQRFRFRVEDLEEVPRLKFDIDRI